MAQRRILLVFFSFFMLVAARQRAVRHPATEWPLTAGPADKYSVAQPTQVTTNHVELDLTVDFAQRKLRGTATLYIDNLTGTNNLRLDANSLDITSIKLDGETQTQWTLTGQPPMQTLDVAIQPDTDTVTIAYSTRPVNGGLFWLTKEQTLGDEQPYLYSLNEPIGARSWIPIQDTPTVRMTYNATIHAPRGSMALMSAENNPRQTNDTGVYMFRMSYPIPAYLIAIAVGRMEYRDLDERTGVYAEPQLIDDAAWEVQYLPAMLDASERMLGQFPFSRHDVVFMPPEFVAGGMEHPMANFISPNIIAGTKPDVPQPHAVIAHELAHTWAGDSTTLGSWNDVWLNEGITSYLENRFIGMLTDADTENYWWWTDRRSFTAFAQSADPSSTVLHSDVPYPGFGFGAAGYIKGALFIKTLEDNIGRDRFDQFLWRYFRTFAFRWIDHENFLAYLREKVVGGDQQLEERLRLEDWVYGTGIPSNITAPATSALEQRARQRAQQFAGGRPFAQLDPQSWSPLELTVFLNNASVGSRLAEIDAVLQLSGRSSPPTPWLVESIRTKYAPGLAAVERVLARPTPSSRVVNLYRTLNETASGRALALQWFERYRGVYDRNTESSVESYLSGNGAGAVAKNAA